MFRFIHAADLHLDSPLRGLQQYEGAPVERLRGATRQALRGLVDLALGERVDFVLLAGDIYDGDWKDYQTGLFFATQMTRLREADIPVFMISGNHDAESQITRSLRLPENVHVLSTRAPETRTLDDLGVAIHGQGFTTRDCPDDLSARYPAPVKGLFNIGLLHTSCDGREGHAPYAPCTLDGLKARGYDYWALGHVHGREVLCLSPYIVFPGNLQGRHARETGPKGCTVVTVNGDTKLEHRPLDVVRWQVARVDATGVRDADEIVTRACRIAADALAGADGRAVALRLEIAGRSAAHARLAANPEHWTAQIRAGVADATSHEVWVEKVRFGTQPEVDLAHLAGDDAFGGLVRALEGMDTGSLRSLADDLFADLERKIPAELREADLDLRNPDLLASAMTDVQALLTARLLEVAP